MLCVCMKSLIIFVECFGVLGVARQGILGHDQNVVLVFDVTIVVEHQLFIAVGFLWGRFCSIIFYFFVIL